MKNIFIKADAFPVSAFLFSQKVYNVYITR